MPSALATIERLERLRAVLPAKLPDDADVAVLTDAIGAVLDGRHDSLDQALDLKSVPGHGTWREVVARERRDEFLREAAERFRLTADELADEINIYVNRGGWIREQGVEQCPAIHSGKPRALVWHAMKAWLRPVGIKQLKRIVGT